MKLTKTKLNGLDFWYREDDKFVGQRIALQKYEEYETKLIEYEALRLAKLTQGTAVAVDVGANIGYYTLLLAKKCKRVYAIEPEKTCFEILKKNVEANNLRNVVLINQAAGGKKEEVVIIHNNKNFGDHKIKTPQSFGRLPLTVELSNIPCNSLDNMLKKEKRIDLIKIDTQGWEPQVVAGAKKIIERDSPVLFLEYTPSEYLDESMIRFLERIYKHIWSIDYWFYVCRKGVRINSKTGYVDLWLKRKMTIGDWIETIRSVQIKKVVKSIIMGYGKNKID